MAGGADDPDDPTRTDTRASLAPAEERRRRSPAARLAAGGAVGAAAWIAGLVFTLLIVQTIGFGGDAPAGDAELDLGDGDDVSVLGLIFFGAHLVDTEPRPALTDGFNFVTELAETVDPTYRVLFLVPPLVLVGGGAALAALDGSPLAGPGVVAGYLPPSVVGATLFAVEVPAGPVTVGLTAPATAAVVLAGAVYPLVLGALGGLAAHGLGVTRG